MVVDIEGDVTAPVQHHLDDLTSRATLVFFALTVVSILWLTQIDELLHRVLSILNPCDDDCLNLYDPAEWSAVRWLASVLLGLLTVMPLIVQQTWSFSKPGLYPHERTWLLSWLLIGCTVTLGIAAFTVGYFFPLAFEQGHLHQSSMGLSSQYDAVLMLKMAVAVVWTQVVVAIAIFAMILAGKLGLLNQSNADWWRFRIYGTVVLLLLASMPEYSSIALLASIVCITVIESVARRWLSASISEPLSLPENC